MMELSQKRTIAAPVPMTPGKQQSRLVIALVLLLVALAAVLIKDRQFWFGSESTIIDANDYQEPVAVQPATQTAQNASEASPKATAPAVTHSPAGAKKQIPAANAQSQPKPAEEPAVVTNRTVLPPLDVEVIAGDTHHNLRPGNKALATNAAQRERLADAIPPSYPPLAQHMNVQGSVVLQALIAADGSIESLRVMSGPAILSNAAQQAVREWHFKPVYQNGQAVETKATITVNFSIRVADSSANTTLAENGDLVITR